MPQMFPMSMLILSVVVMGFVVFCIIRLFWTVSTSPILYSSSKTDSLNSFLHPW